MIVSLDRLTDPEIRRALERGKDYLPEDIEIVERGDGFVRAKVKCRETCGARQFHDGKHDVVLWWNRISTCDCPAVHGCCKHIAALWAHEGGAIPDKPKDCANYGCGGQLMYYHGGNGHAAQCPRYGDPEDVYEAPRTGRSPGYRSSSPTELPRRKPLDLAAASRTNGRQKTIDRTRPTIEPNEGAIVIRRACGHVAWSGYVFGTETLPLSPFEGCPECNDSMTPPAPDQVRARQEAQ